VLTVALVARLVVVEQPTAATRVLAAWIEAASALAGEEDEAGRMLRVLVDLGRTSVADLADLGASERQRDVVVTRNADRPRVVLRRHAEPGNHGGLSAAGVRAARLAARVGPPGPASCGPSLRTTTTAGAWGAGSVVDPAWDLPPREVEVLVGSHPTFGRWTGVVDGSARRYCGTVAEPVAATIAAGRSVAVITHDGVPQAVLAGLGIDPGAIGRGDPLGHLEGLVVERTDEADGFRARRISAPPTELIELVERTAST